MKISCIVCAYNEEKRIGNVLEVLNTCDLFDEVLVINDGSTDGTVNIVKKYNNIKLISHTKNMGKSMAVVTGIENSKNELLVFIDADLVGLTCEDLLKLVEPVLQGRVDLSLSLRKNSLLIYKIIGLDFVSGERAIKKDLLVPYVEKIKTLSGFGIEVFMNEVIIEKRLSMAVVFWRNVVALRKSSKMGLLKGTFGDFKMIIDMLKTISFFEIIRQNFKLRTLIKVRS